MSSSSRPKQLSSTPLSLISSEENIGFPTTAAFLGRDLFSFTFKSFGEIKLFFLFNKGVSEHSIVVFRSPVSKRKTTDLWRGHSSKYTILKLFCHYLPVLVIFILLLLGVSESNLNTLFFILAAFSTSFSALCKVFFFAFIIWLPLGSFEQLEIWHPVLSSDKLSVPLIFWLALPAGTSPHCFLSFFL